MPALEADALAAELSRTRFGGRKVHLVADRSSCLEGNPLWLKTLGSRVTVSLLKAPEGGGLAVKACPTKTSYLCKERVLRLHQGEGKSADKPHNKDKEKSLIKMKSCWSLEIALAPLTLSLIHI